MMKDPTVIIPLGGYCVGVSGETGEMAGTLMYMYMHARDETGCSEWQAGMERLAACLLACTSPA